MATYDAVGGNVNLPLSVVKVTGGAVEKQALKMSNITGPGDNGHVVFKEGNYRYGFSIQGVYQEGSPSSDTLDENVTGSATIAVGNGEQWSGDVIIQRLRASPEWGPGGAIGVQIQGVFTGEVTVAHPS